MPTQGTFDTSLNEDTISTLTLSAIASNAGAGTGAGEGYDGITITDSTDTTTLVSLTNNTYSDPLDGSIISITPPIFTRLNTHGIDSTDLIMFARNEGVSISYPQDSDRTYAIKPWKVMNDGSIAGTVSDDWLQSDSVGQDMSICYLRTSVAAQGTLSFQWKISSEGTGNYDNGVFAITSADVDTTWFRLGGGANSLVYQKIGGEVGWTTVTIDLEALGTTSDLTIDWAFFKDPNTASGQDSFYLDNFVLTDGVAKGTNILGPITYQPATNWNGSKQYNCYFTDSTSVEPSSSIISLNYLVTPVDDAPVLADFTMPTPQVDLNTYTTDIDSDLTNVSYSIIPNNKYIVEDITFAIPDISSWTAIGNGWWSWNSSIKISLGGTNFINFGGIQYTSIYGGNGRFTFGAGYDYTESIPDFNVKPMICPVWDIEGHHSGHQTSDPAGQYYGVSKYKIENDELKIYILTREYDHHTNWIGPSRHEYLVTIQLNTAAQGDITFEYGLMTGEGAKPGANFGARDGIIGVSYGTNNATTLTSSNVDFLNTPTMTSLTSNAPFMQQFLASDVPGTGTDLFSNKKITFGLASETPVGITLNGSMLSVNTNLYTHNSLGVGVMNNGATMSSVITIVPSIIEEFLLQDISNTTPEDVPTIIDFNDGIWQGWDTLHIGDSNGTEILTNTTVPSAIVTVANNVVGGTLQFITSTTLRYVPSHNYVGAEIFTFHGSMTTGNVSNTKTITINMTTVDDPPVVQDFTINRVAGSTDFDLKNYTTDVDSNLDNVSYSILEENINLSAKATMSSSTNQTHYSWNAIDGNESTRWSSGFSDPQWWKVDLLETVNVNGVDFKWETAYGSSYEIQVSTDGTNFQTVAAVSLGQSGWKRTDFNSVSARYVRMHGITRGTQYGYSFYEARVYTPIDHLVTGLSKVGSILTFDWPPTTPGAGGLLLPSATATYQARNDGLTSNVGTITFPALYATPTCFPKGTPVTTDQGTIVIEQLNPDHHSIRGNKIVAITHSTPLQKHIVCFEKDSLGNHIPSQQTLCSKEHKVFYQGKMIKARNLVECCEKVYFVPYHGEILYNVLLKKHGKMMINNLICETLHPENIAAKLSTMENGPEKRKIMTEFNKRMNRDSCTVRTIGA